MLPSSGSLSTEFQAGAQGSGCGAGQDSPPSAGYLVGLQIKVGAKLKILEVSRVGRLASNLLYPIDQAHILIQV